MTIYRVLRTMYYVLAASRSKRLPQGELHKCWAGGRPTDDGCQVSKAKVTASQLWVISRPDLSLFYRPLPTSVRPNFCMGSKIRFASHVCAVPAQAQLRLSQM